MSLSTWKVLKISYERWRIFFSLASEDIAEHVTKILHEFVLIEQIFFLIEIPSCWVSS